MMVLIVNEQIRNGWLEWFLQVQFDLSFSEETEVTRSGGQAKKITEQAEIQANMDEQAEQQANVDEQAEQQANVDEHQRMPSNKTQASRRFSLLSLLPSCCFRAKAQEVDPSEDLTSTEYAGGDAREHMQKEDMHHALPMDPKPRMKKTETGVTGVWDVRGLVSTTADNNPDGFMPVIIPLPWAPHLGPQPDSIAIRGGQLAEEFPPPPPSFSMVAAHKRAAARKHRSRAWSY